jgi:hypothetical protein
MRRFNFTLILVILLGSNATAQTPAAFRVLFGVNDSTQTRWDGALTVKSGGQCSLEPWRFEGVDNIDGQLFHFFTHPDRHFDTPGAGLPVANGFILTATAVTDSSEFHFSTAQGEFSFLASEAPFGKGIYKLGGRVYVDRVPVTARLTDTPERGEFHRHSDVSSDGENDGSLFDQWRYIRDAAALDWVGCCDHDNGGGREYSWWITQKLTDVFYTPGKFSPMFSYERRVNYPDGPRNVIFAHCDIPALPRLYPPHWPRPPKKAITGIPPTARCFTPI